MFDEEWYLYSALVDDDDFLDNDDLNEQIESLSRMNPFQNYYPESERSEKTIKAEIKCECGSEKCNLPVHSDWCMKYKK
jgi:hypothetical protein